MTTGVGSEVSVDGADQGGEGDEAGSCGCDARSEDEEFPPGAGFAFRREGTHPHPHALLMWQPASLLRLI